VQLWFSVRLRPTTPHLSDTNTGEGLEDLDTGDQKEVLIKPYQPRRQLKSLLLRSIGQGTR